MYDKIVFLGLILFKLCIIFNSRIENSKIITQILKQTEKLISNNLKEIPMIVLN